MTAARVGDIEATLEILKTEFTANLCTAQNLQQGNNLVGEQKRNNHSVLQDMQRQILAVKDEVSRLSIAALIKRKGKKYYLKCK